jgi:hypothetical protein
MEVVMKPRVIVIVGVLAALLSIAASAGENSVLSVFADLKSYQECNMNRYEKNFLGSLNYPDCSEIIECGLAQVAMIKLAQPQTPLRKLKNKIDELIANGETPDVRYKAYLANVVFEHPEYFIFEKYGTYADGDELFAALAERLQKKLLVVK